MFNVDTAWDRPCHTGNSSKPHTLRLRITPRSGSTATSGLPLRLAIVLDTSDSMSGEKLERAKTACESVLKQLRAQDKLWLATYSTGINTLLSGVAGGPAIKSEVAAQISSLKAQGITRTDLALNWIKSVLDHENDGMRVGILITDGHATDARGSILQDVAPLIGQASQLGSNGYSLHTVGLGRAEHFNSAFLVDICDRGRGSFLYADAPDKLEALLHEQLASSQKFLIDDLRLTTSALLTGVRPDAFCRIRPDYVPCDTTPEGDNIRVGAIRADLPTDLLVRVQIPSLRFGEAPGNRNVLALELHSKALTEPYKIVASIRYTNSFAESQQLNREVDQDRLTWDINVYTSQLNRTDDPYATGELLSQIQHTAHKAGQSDIEEHAQQSLADLEASGKINYHDSASLGVKARRTRKSGASIQFGTDPIPGVDTKQTSPKLSPNTAQLRVLSGPRAGQTFALNKNRLLIGRNQPPLSTVDVDLSDCESESPPKSSRHHAEMQWINGELFIVDLESRNGTYVDNERLESASGASSALRRLSVGNKVRFGSIDMEIVSE